MDLERLRIDRVVEEKKFEKPNKLSQLPPFDGKKTSGILEVAGCEW